jgi:hypothetical protein
MEGYAQLCISACAGNDRSSASHERETLSDRFTFLLGRSGGALLFETRTSHAYRE